MIATYILPQKLSSFTDIYPNTQGAKEYDDIPYTLYIPKYHDDGEVGNILARNYLDDSREYEAYFDFIRWFNEADGKFDISLFIKR